MLFCVVPASRCTGGKRFLHDRFDLQHRGQRVLVVAAHALELADVAQGKQQVLAVLGHHRGEGLVGPSKRGLRRREIAGRVGDDAAPIVNHLEGGMVLADRGAHALCSPFEGRRSGIEVGLPRVDVREQQLFGVAAWLIGGDGEHRVSPARRGLHRVCRARRVRCRGPGGGRTRVGIRRGPAPGPLRRSRTTGSSHRGPTRCARCAAPSRSRSSRAVGRRRSGSRAARRDERP
jgi:hypothetical protein